MPYPNEHACRLTPPGRFVRFKRVKNERSHNGKPYDVIYGIQRDNKTVEQAYRYPKDTWRVSDAQSHCRAHKGILFEPASEVQELDIPFTVQKEPMHIQRAYIREFKRVLEITGSSLAAKKSADQIIRQSHIEGDDRSAKVSVQLKASIKELDNTDHLPDEVVQKIKDNGDKHPFFAVFRLGSEGISKGSGFIKIWSFRAIKELVGRIRESAGKVIVDFHTRSKDEQRTSVGKLVHAVSRRIGNKLQAIGIIHVTDPDTKEKIKTGHYNTCSIDAECLLEKKKGNWFIRGVEKFTNLVIANDREAEPGFASAGLITTIQELETREIREMGKESEERITLTDVKIAIERNGWSAEQLFTKKEILGLPVVSEEVSSKVDEAVTAKEEEIGKLNEKVKRGDQFRSKLLVQQAITNSSLLADKGDKVTAYIKDQISVDIGGIKDEDIQSKVDEVVKKELERIETLGIRFGDGKTDKKDQDQIGAGKDSGGNQGDKSDMTNPANNPLIPQ